MVFAHRPQRRRRRRPDRLAAERLEARCLLAADMMAGIRQIDWGGETVTARVDGWIVTTEGGAPQVASGWSSKSLGGQRLSRQATRPARARRPGAAPLRGPCPARRTQCRLRGPRGGHDLFSSFLSACAVITLIMMLVERGVLAGLVAMVPNLFPIVLLFGFLCWTRTALDIGSVMTASIALGMAVDGTCHFLTVFRRGLPQGRSLSAAKDREQRIAAVHEAYRQSASPLTQTAVVCGLGILVFAASSFAPSRRFAGMLSLLVGAALVSDLVLLPALLVGPLGRHFRPSARGEAVASST